MDWRILNIFIYKFHNHVVLHTDFVVFQKVEMCLLVLMSICLVWKELTKKVCCHALMLLSTFRLCHHFVRHCTALFCDVVYLTKRSLDIIERFGNIFAVLMTKCLYRVISNTILHFYFAYIIYFLYFTYIIYFGKINDICTYFAFLLQ
ncbi:Protein of unknown function [Gryllus bimaculatus]|nr:Protein of unknown function [Gryllus bimaculatus]